MRGMHHIIREPPLLIVRWAGYVTEAPSVGNGLHSYSILRGNLEGGTEGRSLLVSGCSNL